MPAWREWLLSHERRQPFRQGFREVYLLTDAERASSPYSNRSAAHVLRYHQLHALFKVRGWPANYLGDFSEGYEARARRSFDEAGITVVFEHHQLESADRRGYLEPVAVAGSGRVWFHRTGERAKTPLDLADVPPLVFSEAMRDVDLLTSTTSIALDPAWGLETEEHRAYWESAATGAISGLAQTRRAALAAIVPRLRIAGRLRVDDRWVHVEGRVEDYRVHIGSGAVFLERGDRHICIVKGRSPGKVMLPFEGDEMLAVVLSKVLLLAADDTITDEVILRQLGR